jgi:hypothetical protein
MQVRPVGKDLVHSWRHRPSLHLIHGDGLAIGSAADQLMRVRSMEQWSEKDGQVAEHHCETPLLAVIDQ